MTMYLIFQRAVPTAPRKVHSNWVTTSTDASSRIKCNNLPPAETEKAHTPKSLVHVAWVKKPFHRQSTKPSGVNPTSASAGSHWRR